MKQEIKKLIQKRKEEEIELRDAEEIMRESIEHQLKAKQKIAQIDSVIKRLK